MPPPDKFVSPAVNVAPKKARVRTPIPSSRTDQNSPSPPITGEIQLIPNNEELEIFKKINEINQLLATNNDPVVVDTKGSSLTINNILDELNQTISEHEDPMIISAMSLDDEPVSIPINIDTEHDLVIIEEPKGEQLTEEKAAIKIQAAYRGYDVRKNISRENSPFDLNKYSSSGKIDKPELNSQTGVELSSEPLLNVNYKANIDKVEVDTASEFETKSSLKKNIFGKLNFDLGKKEPDVDLKGYSRNPEFDMNTDLNINKNDADLKNVQSTPELQTNLDLKSSEINVDGSTKKNFMDKLSFGFSKKKSDLDLKNDSNVPEMGLSMENPGFDSSVDMKTKDPETDSNSGFGFKSNFGLRKPEFGFKAGFGSNKSKDLKTEVNTELDRDINLNQEIDVKNFNVNFNSPDLKTNLKTPELGVEVTKPECDSKVGLSMKKPDGYVDVKIPDVQIKTDSDMNFPKVELKESSPDIDVKGSFKKNIVNPAKSLFGKLNFDLGKKGTDVNFDADKPDVDLNVKRPEINIKASSSEIDTKVKNPDVDLEINNPEMKVGLKSPELGIDVKKPEVDSKIDLDSKKSRFGFKTNFGLKDSNVKAGIEKPEMNAELKKPEISIKSNVEAPKLETEIRGSSPDVELKDSFKKNIAVPTKNLFGKLNFGLNKTNPEADLNVDDDVEKPEINLNLQKPNVVMETDLSFNKPEIEPKKSGFGIKTNFGLKKPEVNVDIKNPEIEVNVKKPQVNIKSNNDLKTKKLGFGFKTNSGEKNPEIGVDLEKPEVSVNVKKPEIDVEIKKLGAITEPNLDLGTLKLESNVRGSSPDVDVKGSFKKNIVEPTITLLGKINFGSSKTKPDLDVNLDIEKPKVVIKTELEMKAPELKADMKTMGADVDINLENSKINVETTKPKIDVESNLDMNAPKNEADFTFSPDIDVKGSFKKNIVDPTKNLFGKLSLSSGKTKPEVDLDTNVDVEKPEIKANVEVDYDLDKPKLDSNVKKSGFGFKTNFGFKKSDVNIEAKKPEVSFETNLDRKTPELKADVRTSSPEFDINVEKPEVDLNTKKSGFGFKTNFGLKKPEINVDVKKPEVSFGTNLDGKNPELKADVRASSPEFDINVKKPEIDPKVCSSDKNSGFGFKTNFGLKKPEAKVDIDKSEIDFKVNQPKVDTESNVNIKGLKLNTDSKESSPDIDIKGSFKKNIVNPTKNFMEKLNFGSNKAKPEIDFEAELANPKCNIESGTPTLKADIRTPSPDLKNKKTGFGFKTNFGFKKPEVELEADKSEINIDADIPDFQPDVKTSSLDIDPETELKSKSSSFGVKANFKKLNDSDSINAPQFKADVQTASPDTNIKDSFNKNIIDPTKNFIEKITFDLGKSKPEIDADANFEKPKVELMSVKKAPEFDADFNFDRPDFDPKESSKAKNSGFGIKSNFSMKKPEIEANVRTPSPDIDLKDSFKKNIADPAKNFLNKLNFDTNKSKPKLEINVGEPELEFETRALSPVLEKKFSDLGLSSDLPEDMIKANFEPIKKTVQSTKLSFNMNSPKAPETELEFEPRALSPVLEKQFSDLGFTSDSPDDLISPDFEQIKKTIQATKVCIDVNKPEISEPGIEFETRALSPVLEKQFSDLGLSSDLPEDMIKANFEPIKKTVQSTKLSFNMNSPKAPETELEFEPRALSPVLEKQFSDLGFTSDSPDDLISPDFEQIKKTIQATKVCIDVNKPEISEPGIEFETRALSPVLEKQFSDLGLSSDLPEDMIKANFEPIKKAFQSTKISLDMSSPNVPEPELEFETRALSPVLEKQLSELGLTSDFPEDVINADFEPIQVTIQSARRNLTMTDPQITEERISKKVVSEQNIDPFSINVQSALSGFGSMFNKVLDDNLSNKKGSVKNSISNPLKGSIQSVTTDVQNKLNEVLSGKKQTVDADLSAADDIQKQLDDILNAQSSNVVFEKQENSSNLVDHFSNSLKNTVQSSINDVSANFGKMFQTPEAKMEVKGQPTNIIDPLLNPLKQTIETTVSDVQNKICGMIGGVQTPEASVEVKGQPANIIDPLLNPLKQTVETTVSDVQNKISGIFGGTLTAEESVEVKGQPANIIDPLLNPLKESIQSAATEMHSKLNNILYVKPSETEIQIKQESTKILDPLIDPLKEKVQSTVLDVQAKLSDMLNTKSNVETEIDLSSSIYPTLEPLDEALKSFETNEKDKEKPKSIIDPMLDPLKENIQSTVTKITKAFGGDTTMETTVETKSFVDPLLDSVKDQVQSTISGLETKFKDVLEAKSPTKEESVNIINSMMDPLSGNIQTTFTKLSRTFGGEPTLETNVGKENPLLDTVKDQLKSTISGFESKFSDIVNTKSECMEESKNITNSMFESLKDNFQNTTSSLTKAFSKEQTTEDNSMESQSFQEQINSTISNVETNMKDVFNSVSTAGQKELKNVAEQMFGSIQKNFQNTESSIAKTCSEEQTLESKNQSFEEQIQSTVTNLESKLEDVLSKTSFTSDNEISSSMFDPVKNSIQTTVSSITKVLNDEPKSKCKIETSEKEFMDNNMSMKEFEVSFF